MRYAHQLTAIHVIKVAAPRWANVPNRAVSTTHEGEIYDLSQFIAEGEQPLAFAADDLPKGFLLSPYGKLMTDGTQEEGLHAIDVRAQNAVIAPLWVNAVPFVVQVAHAPEPAAGDADAVPKHTNLSLGISN